MQQSGDEIKKMNEEDLTHSTLLSLLKVTEIGNEIIESAKQMLKIIVNIHKLLPNNNLRHFNSKTNSYLVTALLNQLEERSIKFETNLEQASRSFQEAALMIHTIGNRALDSIIVYQREDLINLRNISSNMHYDCSQIPTEVLRVCSLI